MTVVGLNDLHKALLLRLGGWSPIYLASPERQAAARDLERAGLCRCAWGEGGDRGLLLAYRGAGWTKRGEGDWTPPDQPPVMRTAPGGGDVA